MDPPVGNDLDIVIGQQEVEQEPLFCSVSHTRSIEKTSTARSRADSPRSSWADPGSARPRSESVRRVCFRTHRSSARLSSGAPGMAAHAPCVAQQMGEDPARAHDTTVPTRRRRRSRRRPPEATATPEATTAATPVTAVAAASDARHAAEQAEDESDDTHHQRRGHGSDQQPCDRADRPADQGGGGQPSKQRAEDAADYHHEDESDDEQGLVGLDPDWGCLPGLGGGNGSPSIRP